jgi:DNA-binding MarR family transcriptional regulator
VAAGYVTRREDLHDRRVRRIELSPGGEELLNSIAVAGEEHHRRLLNRLSVEELHVVADAFEIMSKALEQDEAERASE